ncbi:hypothetical protein BDR07DRAFT_1379855 [Suillus spraguei]|nr:hypothetical protein BDR07DRAFT_1379855 [Suillus spraguei]
MLNLVRKPSGSARYLQTSARAAALVQKQKQHHDHVQLPPEPRPVICGADVEKGRERELDLVRKTVKHVKCNELGVQLLSRQLDSQIFSDVSFPAPSRAFVRIAQEHLEMHGLDPKQDSVLPDIDFTLPPLLDCASNELPPRPDLWDIQSGWTKYYFHADGSSYSEHVEFPQHEGNAEEVLTFDVETMPAYHPCAIMACAASKNAWYTWTLPWDTLSPRVIVGHNVCYDRARILEEYNLHGTQSRFLDTMALHVAVNGISSHQRPAWMKHCKSKETQRVRHAEAVGAIIELMRVAEFKLDQEDDENKREQLRRLRADLEESPPQLEPADVDAVEADLSMVRNDFLKLTPEEIRDNIYNYLNYCTQDVFVTHAVFSKVLLAFLHRCPGPVSFAGTLTMGMGSSFLTVNESWESYLADADRVYRGLDGKLDSMTVCPSTIPDSSLRRKKSGSKELKPKVFWPKWYWELAKPKKDMPLGTLDVTLDFYDPMDDTLQNMRLKGCFVFHNLPHKDGEKANVGSPLGKSHEICAGWDTHEPWHRSEGCIGHERAVQLLISAHDRILNQMVVWRRGTLDLQFEQPERLDEPRKWGIILPQVITMGTVTRPAIERTWLTASNAKKNRVGSELKAMFGLHGATALEWITLEGTKAAGTDLHSKTASILGISRDQAKVFNYSRIYGAGMRHAVLLLLQSNAGMLPDQAQRLAENLYASTKGKNTHRTDLFGRKFWFCGTESFVFNKLEEIALSDQPRTPALWCGITAALSKELLPEKFGSDYMTSRINKLGRAVPWCRLLAPSHCRNGPSARYLISVHDELRYLVAEEDCYRAALALQIANLWTRSLFAFKLGMDDLPQGVAFFSAVDIDKVLRKEVDIPYVTPSHPDAIPPGESLSITGILDKTNNGSLRKDGPTMTVDFSPSKASDQDYEPPNCLIHRAESAAWLCAQATSGFPEIKHLAQQTSGQVIDTRIHGAQSSKKKRGRPEKQGGNARSVEIRQPTLKSSS